MKFEFIPYDRNRYATNLQRAFDGNHLKWDSSPSQDVLLVKSAFEKPLSGEEENIAAALSELKSLPEGEFVKLYDNVYARYVSAREFGQNNGASITGGGARYTVFAVFLNREEGKGLIYESSNQVMIKNYCDIIAEATITCTRYMTVRGLFKRKTETDFWTVSVEDSILLGYNEGDLYYKLRNIEVPITRDMISRPEFYIRAEEVPEFGTRNPGIHLTILQ